MLKGHPATYKEEQLSEWIDHLVADQIQENPYLDYKQTINLGSSGEKAELCKDVTSFANTNGGTILYGIPEKRDGDQAAIPCSPYGMDPIKGLEEQMENILADAVHPRLPELKIRKVPVKGEPNKVVYLAWHPASWIGPHMIMSFKEQRYYGRGNFRPAIMSEAEIRERYLLLAQAASRVDSVVEELDGSLPIFSIPELPKTRIYVIPHYLSERINILDREFRLWAENHRIRAYGRLPSWLPSVHGIAVVDEQDSDPEYHYLNEIWKNGIIINVHNTPVNNKNIEGINVLLYRGEISAIQDVLALAGELYQFIAYQGPVRVRIHLDGVIKLRFQDAPYSLREPQIKSNGAIIDLDVEATTISFNTDQVLRQLADRLFQIFGMWDARRLFSEEKFLR